MTVGMALIFLVSTSARIGDATTNCTLPQATELNIREVIKNCTSSCASDHEILDCLVPEFQTSGWCSRCTPKTDDELATQYQKIGIPFEEKAFVLSKLPAAKHRCNGRHQYVGFPNRAFIKNMTITSCVPRNYTYVDLGEGYFPSTLMVVAECGNRVTDCESETCKIDCHHFQLPINDIITLKRSGCNEDGTENWLTHKLDVHHDSVPPIPLTCCCSLD